MINYEQKLEEIYQYLLQEADSETAEGEDFDVDNMFDPKDYSGGNFDDCYSMGIDQGYKLQAEHILGRFFKERLIESVENVY